MYAPPKKNEAGKAAKAITPAKTGAQQVVAIPENIPKTKTDPRPLPLSCGWTNTGNENCIPETKVNPKSIKNREPKEKIRL